jgi:hypothetical protein
MLFSLTLQFEPQTIIEVGRGYGNSTCVFLEAAAMLHCTLLSFCLDYAGRAWSGTEARVRSIRGPEWFAPAKILVEQDFTKVPPSDVLSGSTGRTLFFWDAHGRGIGEHIVNRFLPLLQTRPHLVIVHDITDLRGGLLPSRGYRREGDFSTPFKEIVPLYKLWQRDGTVVRSPAYDVVLAAAADPERIRILTEKFPEASRPIIGVAGHWVYFEMTEPLPQGDRDRRGGPLAALVSRLFRRSGSRGQNRSD